jgi:predicted transcriptional regulator of viral defense system
METLNSYILDLLAQGKYFFTKQDALTALGININQFKYQAYRLTVKKIIKRITNDFFMIVSPEYRHIGSLPSHWIINALMKHLDQEYYIGLLSAASLFGATEQQPMSFQVITNKTTRPIHLARISIEFHTFKYCLLAQKATISTPTGYAKISTKEQTMLDLIRFYEAAGYLSNVALVIKSLAAECNYERFIVALAHEKTKTVLQRLGYILETTNFIEPAQLVEKELSNRKTEYAFLRPDFENKAGKKNIRWKLILNDSLEIP